MARPKKQGLDYFPFDVDFFEDEKIEAIGGEFGLKGEIIAIRLLCAIYRNGYFIVWNDLLKMKLIRRLPGVSKELIDQIINRLVKWGFFNEDLFNSDKVLTSEGIQKRFHEATKRRNGSTINQYSCLSGVNVNNNPSTTGINVSNNPQSKVKESKVKEKRENNARSQKKSGVKKPEKNTPPVPRDPPLFSKPSFEEVYQFFRSAGGNKVMAEKFYNKWEAVGWMSGISPVKNFRGLANNFIVNFKQNEKRYAKNKRDDQKTDKRLGGFNLALDDLKSSLESRGRDIEDEV